MSQDLRAAYAESLAALSRITVEYERATAAAEQSHRTRCDAADNSATSTAARAAALRQLAEQALKDGRSRLQAIELQHLLPLKVHPRAYANGSLNAENAVRKLDDGVRAVEKGCTAVAEHRRLSRQLRLEEAEARERAAVEARQREAAERALAEAEAKRRAAIKRANVRAAMTAALLFAVGLVAGLVFASPLAAIGAGSIAAAIAFVAVRSANMPQRPEPDR